MFENDEVKMNTERQIMRKHILKHTPPLSGNPIISFPEHYSKGRIVIQLGIRMLDWDGEKWVAYTKDGTKWYSNDLSEEDYNILDRALSQQIGDFTVSGGQNQI